MNGRPIPGMEKFRGLVDVDDTFPLTFFDQYMLAEITAELACSCYAGVLTLQGMGDFLGRIDQVQHYREDLLQWNIIPTFYDRRVSKSAEIMEQLERYFPGAVWPAVRYNVRLSEAPAFGQHIFEYAKKSNGAADYARLAHRLAKGAGAKTWAIGEKYPKISWEPSWVRVGRGIQSGWVSRSIFPNRSARSWTSSSSTWKRIFALPSPRLPRLPFGSL